MRRIKELPGHQIEIIRIPTGIELDASFARIFEGDEQMTAALNMRKSKEGPEWFRPEARAARNPEWIFWSTIELDGLARNEYAALFSESSGYRVVFDASSPRLPWWVYPRNTEFLQNRLTVWKRIAS